jgi:hypothetical protein
LTSLVLLLLWVDDLVFSPAGLRTRDAAMLYVKLVYRACKQVVAGWYRMMVIAWKLSTRIRQSLFDRRA